MANKKPALTSISIENFKGVGSRVTIPFKPLMLFFGPNNAGKSTVIEALLLANEVMNGRNPNVDKVELGGDLIRLGGFKSYVHGKDTDNVVKIRIEASIGKGGLPSYEKPLSMMLNNDIMERFNPEIAPYDADTCTNFIKEHNINELLDIETCFIEFTLEDFGQNIGVGYEAGLNGEWVVKTANGHSLFSIFPVNDLLFGHADIPEGEYEFEFNSNHQALRSLSRQSELTADILNILDNHECEVQPLCDIKHSSNGKDITFDKPLCFNRIDDLPDNELVRDIFPEAPFIQQDELVLLSHIASQLLVGARKKLASILSSHLFIGPFRSIPERGIEAVKEEDISWSDGSAAWSELLRPRLTPSRLKALTDLQVEEVMADPSKKDDLNERQAAMIMYLAHLKAVDKWETSSPDPEEYGAILNAVNGALEIVGIVDKRLVCDSKYVVDGEYLENIISRKTRGLNTDGLDAGEAALRAIRNGLSGMDVRLEVMFENIKTKQTLNIRDIGSGISQLVPVIVAFLAPSSLTSIEQPELHLHPAWQCGLGDLFIFGAKLWTLRDHIRGDGDDKIEGNPQPRILVETHSEHMLLRILRRIRETARQNVPEGYQMTPQQLGVFAVEEEDDGTHIYEMEISEEGELLTPWPNGFFPERMQEILGIDR